MKLLTIGLATAVPVVGYLLWRKYGAINTDSSDEMKKPNANGAGISGSKSSRDLNSNSRTGIGSNSIYGVSKEKAL